MTSHLKHAAQRDQVAAPALSLLTTRLVVNTSGNVSLRVDDEIFDHSQRSGL